MCSCSERPDGGRMGAVVPAALAETADIQMTTAAMFNPKHLDREVRFQSVLQVTPTSVPETSFSLAQALSEAMRVEVVLDQVLVNRLFALWNGLFVLDADEVSDWALPATAVVTDCKLLAVPTLLSIGATVSASGEATLSAVFEGVDMPLWLSSMLDLNDLVSHEEARS